MENDLRADFFLRGVKKERENLMRKIEREREENNKLITQLKKFLFFHVWRKQRIKIRRDLVNTTV